MKDKKVKSRSRVSGASATNIIRKDPLGVVLIFGKYYTDLTLICLFLPFSFSFIRCLELSPPALSCTSRYVS